MVIETLKAQISALTEASKEKGVPEKVKTTITESAAKLQKLLDKAREAAKESYQAKEEEGEEEAGTMPEEEAGKKGEEEEEGSDMPEPGHTITKTLKVKHDKHQSEDGDEPDPKDEKDGKDGDVEESRKVHIEHLLQEAGIPKAAWHTEKLVKMSLKEAKEAVAEKKAIVEEAKKAVEGNLDFVPTGTGDGLQESTGGENLNSLFTGCAE